MEVTFIQNFIKVKTTLRKTIGKGNGHHQHDLDNKRECEAKRKSKITSSERENKRPPHQTFEKLKKIQGGGTPKDVILSIKECQDELKNYQKKEISMYQNMFNKK